MGDPAPGHRRRADDGDGRVVEALQPDQEDVGEVLGMLPERAVPTSSSTKNALPSARVTMSRTRSSGNGTVHSCATRRRTSTASSGSSWNRSTPVIRAQTATWRRSGWRRWMSSER
jgi:hypothetical protein